jgi:sentrin-specific protease 1
MVFCMRAVTGNLLDTVDMTIHHSDFSPSCSDKVIVMHQPSNFEVTREKLQCLRPRCWLNDEVNSC